MSTLKPKIACIVVPVVGYNENGEPLFGAGRPEQCATVRFTHEITHTSVRADATATRAYADDFAATTKILLTPETSARIGDKLQVLGLELRITSLFPRHSVWGHLDHFEVTGTVWG